MDRPELIAKYRFAKTDREKADIELQIWNAIPRHERTGVGMAKQLRPLLNIPLYQISNRYQISLAGKDFEFLWDKIESGMTLGTATRIINEARNAAKKHDLKIKDVIPKIVEAYDSIGYGTTLKSGKVIRKRTFQNLIFEPPNADMLSVLTDQIYEIVLNGCRVYEYDKYKILQELKIDLEILVKEYKRKINKLDRKNAIDQESLMMDDVVNACEILGIDIPQIGESVNSNEVKSKVRSKAKIYHPDVHGGSESTRHKYEEVMWSYKVLQEYNENFANQKIKRSRR
jgi:hypothetical protein